MAVAENPELTGLESFVEPILETDFETLVRRHERQVLGVALRLLGRMADAQDVAQEAFLRLHRNLGGLKSDIAVGSWLYRVTVNLCRDRWREARRKREVDLTAVEDHRQPGAGPEDRAIDAERLQRVRGAMFRLGEKERLALVLRDVEGLPTSEVARTLGVTETTVRVQISKARLKLRELL